MVTCHVTSEVVVVSDDTATGYGGEGEKGVAAYL